MARRPRRILLKGTENACKRQTLCKLAAVSPFTQVQNFEDNLNLLESALIGDNEYTAEENNILKKNMSTLKSRFRSRWQAASRKHNLFMKKNKNWLKRVISVPKGTNKQGRPRKPFAELSERGKRKRTEDIRSLEIEELEFTTEVQLRMAGQLDASKMAKEVVASRRKAKKLREAYDNFEKRKREQLSVLRALQIFIDADLSRKQYDIIRMADKELFPSYKELQKAKQAIHSQY